VLLFDNFGGKIFLLCLKQLCDLQLHLLKSSLQLHLAHLFILLPHSKNTTILVMSINSHIF